MSLVDTRFDATIWRPRHTVISFFAISTNGQTVLTANIAGEMHLWELKKRRQVTSLILNPEYQVLRPGEVLAVQRIEDTEQWAIIEQTDIGHIVLSRWDPNVGVSKMASVEFAEYRQQFAEFSLDGATVAIWRPGLGITVLRRKHENHWPSIAIPGAFTRDCLALNSDGSRLVVAYPGGLLSVFDLEHNGEKNTIEVKADPYSLAVAGEETLVVALGSADGRVNIIDGDGHELHRLQSFGDTTVIRRLSLSRDCRLLAITDNRGEIWIYDLRTRCLLRHICGTGIPHTAMAFAPQGTFLAVLTGISTTSNGYVGIMYLEPRK